MGVYIRNLRTQLFYVEHNHWVRDFADAYDFGRTKQAMKWVDTVKLLDVEIVENQKNRKHLVAYPMLRRNV
jgi:hypothetical protein